MSSLNYLDHGSRLRKDVSSIFEYCFIVEMDTSAKSGTKFQFKYPVGDDDPTINEMIAKSQAFCFPFHLNSSMVRGGHFTFTFTDLEGNYQFGFCKVFPGAKTCYCIGSFLPWFEIFYKLLNYISELMTRSDQNDLVSFLDDLKGRDVPSPREKFCLNKSLTFDVPDVNDLASIPEHRNISEYMAAASKNFRVEMFAYMMNERRIIFTSSNLSTLTACVYSAEALLRPLYWQHIFIPVLPPKMIDHTYAPMPYIIGVHSSIMPEVEKIMSQGEEIVVANIDTEEIQSTYNDLETLPSDSVTFLKSLVRKNDISVGTNLSLAYMRMQARLIGTYRNGLKIQEDKLIFDEDKFIDSFKSSSHREFARNIAQLQCFKEFVEGRLMMLNSGVGFRDRFEVEINAVDDQLAKRNDNYKEWMNAAKKGGNVFISQVKKARHNMKNFSSGLKQQPTSPDHHHHHHHSTLTRSKTLNEEPQRLRPVRPLSTQIPPSADTTDRPRRPRPPRPPPPRFTPNQLREMRTSRTRVYTPLEFQLNSPTLDGESDDEDFERERTFTGPYNPPNINLMADMEDEFDEIRKNADNLSAAELSASSTPNGGGDTNSSNLLIDFSQDIGPPEASGASLPTNTRSNSHQNSSPLERKESLTMSSNPMMEPDSPYLDSTHFYSTPSSLFNGTSSKEGDCSVAALQPAATTTSPMVDNNPWFPSTSSNSEATSVFNDDLFRNLTLTTNSDEPPKAPPSTLLWSSSTEPANTTSPFDAFPSQNHDSYKPRSMTMCHQPLRRTDVRPPSNIPFSTINPTITANNPFSNDWQRTAERVVGETSANMITRTGSHRENSSLRRETPDVFSDLLTMWKKREGM